MAAKFKALHLYTAPLSGCTARIRIAGHLKSIPLIYRTIDISKSEQLSSTYRAINPNGTVPSLAVETSSSEKFVITQSPAILDFLSAHFPDPPLIPGIERPRERARVMELASLVACDIQPPQGTRIRKKITQDFGGDDIAWALWVYERGLTVYERFLETGRKEMGEAKYSVGDEVSLADICLVPAVQAGLRIGIDLEKWPIMKSVVDECWKLEAFRKGGLGGSGQLVP
jgi:maleylacetoacetate isomerase